MVEIGSFTIGILESFIAGLILILLSVVGGWIFSDRFQAFMRKFLNFAFDTKIEVELSRVDRYAHAPTGEVDMALFHEINEVTSSVRFDALTNNVLRVRGSSLPSPLEIRLEEEPPVEGYPDKEGRYEVRVTTYPSLTFGYRSDSALSDFEVLSDQIASTLNTECFESKEPISSFIEGTITNQTMEDDGTVEIPKLELRARGIDGNIALVIGEPRYLSEGIRRFIRPGQRA